MKGHVFAKGEKDIKPVRHLRQVFEYFKKRSDPRRVDENLVFSIGEGDCHLVFYCQATVGSHYYFAVTIKHIPHPDYEQEEIRFWITHKTMWDSIQDIQMEYDQELSWSLPEGFVHTKDGYWKYMVGPTDEGIALLKSYGFEWCDRLEEKLCDEDF